MDALSYLERDTWSTLKMDDWELTALGALLDRVEPTTPAEKVIRDRVHDSIVRRDQVTR